MNEFTTLSRDLWEESAGGLLEWHGKAVGSYLQLLEVP